MNASNSLYHVDITLPEEISQPLHGRYLRLLVSRTAKHRATELGIDLVDHFTLDSKHIVEVGTDLAGKVNHIVVKLPFRITDTQYFALAPDFERGEAVIKTVWMATSKHNHRTLDSRRYVQPALKGPKHSCDDFAYRSKGFSNAPRL